VPEWASAAIICGPPDLIQVKDLPAKWGLLWAIKGQVIVKREARGCPERNLAAEVQFLTRCSGVHKYESVRGRSQNG